MKLNHEDIREKLPDFIKSGLIPDEVKAHLDICKECGHEFSILKALTEVPLPEPGGMFFETLPQKVRASLKEEKKGILSRLVPAFALIALVVLAGYIYQMRTPVLDEGFSFIDPLAPVAFDLNSLSEEDLTLIDEPLEGEEIYLADEIPFLSELAYLSSDEMEDLYEELGIEKENGGVL